MIEISRFRLWAEVEEAAFLAADRQVQVGFTYQQPGAVRRTTARGGDGSWLVLELWRSAADADAAAARRATDTASLALARLVDPGSLETSRYEELGG